MEAPGGQLAAWLLDLHPATPSCLGPRSLAVGTFGGVGLPKAMGPAATELGSGVFRFPCCRGQRNGELELRQNCGCGPEITQATAGVERGSVRPGGLEQLRVGSPWCWPPPQRQLSWWV